MANRMTGRIERLIPDKGFGFIKGEDNREYFFHRSAVQEGFENLDQNQQVTFRPGQGPKGPRAEDVIAE
jgi:CspA family cold shock protein